MNDTRDEIARTLGLGPHRSTRRAWIAASVAAALMALVAGEAEKARYVTSEARRADLVVTVTATGTVEPTNLVEISSELSGTLATVEVDFNDIVEVGSVLARLDTTKLEAQLAIARASLDAAIARVAMAEAMLDDAREKYETARDLDERGVTALQRLVGFGQLVADFEEKVKLLLIILGRGLGVWISNNLKLHLHLLFTHGQFR